MKIIVTGSSSGIGRALAERLLQANHEVWGLARSDQAEFKQAHARSFQSSVCDVAQWPQVAAVATDVARVWGSGDALVCCAGLHGTVGPALQADPSHWSQTVRSNLDGTYYAIRAFYPLLRQSAGRSKVVCFSGGGATKARANFSAYGVAKTGILRLVETIAEEEKDTRLDINAIAPGTINTRLTDEVIALGPTQAGQSEYEGALKQKATGGASLSRALDLVEWLLSAKSDGISGRLLSAPWDPWTTLDRHVEALAKSDVYCLRRITPEERNLDFN